MYRRLQLGFLLGTVIVGASCGQADDGLFETKSSALVASGRAVTNFTDSDPASETATLVSNNGSVMKKVVAFNSLDGAHCSYSSAGKNCCPGASYMGWAVAGASMDWNTDANLSPFTRNRVPALPNSSFPAGQGFPMLMGDPSLGQIKGTNFVYMTSLAVNQKAAPTGCLSSITEANIAGACIARSTDGGSTFVLQDPADCLTDSQTSPSQYDGTAITGTAPSSQIYAAFNDTTHNTIDVWKATTPTSHFTLIADPFPLKNIHSHPRFATDDQNAYLLAADTSGNLWLQCYGGGGLCVQGGPWPMLVATDFTPFNDDVAIGSFTLRRGAQYDLVINNVNKAFGQSVEILYAAKPGDHAILKEVSCHIFTPPRTCVAKGVMDTGVNIFNPALGVADILVGGVETVAFQAAATRQLGSSVEIVSGILNGPNGGTGAIALTSETGTTQPCPFLGTGVGGSNAHVYWGDYNTHIGAVQLTAADTPRFWTSFTDSTDLNGNSSCTLRQPSRSVSMQVSTTWLTSFHL